MMMSTTSIIEEYNTLISHKMLSLSPNTDVRECIGCGDTVSSTVSSSGRILQRFSRQFYDIVVILCFIS